MEEENGCDVMEGCYLLNDTIISPLGFSTRENLQAIKSGNTGLKLQENNRFAAKGFYAGIIEKDLLKEAFTSIGNSQEYTKLEQMMLLAVHEILQQQPNLNLSTTALIISTTKGNIDQLGVANFQQERVLLSGLGELIRQFFGFVQKPIIVSSACISGGLALAVTRRFFRTGKFEQAIVVGGDLVSNFVVSGFQSFQAISNRPCRPFCNGRNGISPGEAAAAILLSTRPVANATNINLTGEASINDANHISGPSRTGEGLFRSINKALEEAGISAKEIDYLSAHGTATLFNDEMESIAFTRAGLIEVPVNSYKGYYGHTLGASALLESILTKHSMLNNEVYPSLNFGKQGTSAKLNLIIEHEKREIHSALKTASGFGGCNLALVFRKEDTNGK